MLINSWFFTPSPPIPFRGHFVCMAFKKNQNFRFSFLKFEDSIFLKFSDDYITLTFWTVKGAQKSIPPWSRKPQGWLSNFDILIDVISAIFVSKFSSIFSPRNLRNHTNLTPFFKKKTLKGNDKGKK